MSSLFYTPTSCGAASFISAHYAGLIQNGKIVPNEVSLQSHQVVHGQHKGEDFYKLNPKGNVPTMILDDSTLLNENVAVLLYIAEQAPDSKLVPEIGTSQRHLLHSKLAYIASEVHPAVGANFGKPINDEHKALLLKKAYSKFEYLEKNEFADGRKFIVGDTFTIADAYLYIVLSWHAYLGLDLAAYPKLKAYFEGIKSLPFVIKAHAAINELSNKD